MNTYTDKNQETKSTSVANSIAQKKSTTSQGLIDNRPESIQLMMKRSTRVAGGLDELADADETTEDYTSGDTTRTVSIGRLRTIYNGRTDEETKRYNILELMLEEIGGNSKGHDRITGNPALLAIFTQVCADLGVSVAWTGLNTEGDSSSSSSDEEGGSDAGGSAGGGSGTVTVGGGD